MNKVEELKCIKWQKKIFPSAFENVNRKYITRALTMTWTLIGCCCPITELLNSFFNISFDIYKYIFIAPIIFSIILIYLLYNKYSKQIIEPYSRKQNFISIYSIDEFKADPQNFIQNLIGRTYEIRYLNSIFISEFDKTTNKRALCLTGESGTGKSTIVNIFMERFKEQYDFFYCCTNYDTVLDKMKYDFSVETYDEAIKEINKISMNRKIIFIFDQFENFFVISKDKQRKFIDEFYNKLIMKNVAALFTIKSNELVNLLSNINLKIDCQNKINNGVLYLFEKDKYIIHPNIAQIEVPSNLLFLGNEKDKTQKENRQDDVISRCNRTFADNAFNVYHFVEDSKIIEQQIVLSVFENENDNTYIDRLIKDNSVNQIIMLYIERQLCSTGFYFEAAQIMYLLGIGRKNNIAFTSEQIGAALFNCKEKSSTVCICLKRLTELHLIKLTENGGKNYEVTHDYIAEKSIEYGNKELTAQTRSVLEFYVENYNNENFKSHVNIIAANKVKSRSALNFCFVLVNFFVIMRYVYFALFLENSNYSICTSVAAISSIIYGYGLYVNAYGLHSCRQRNLIHLVFIVIIPCIAVLIGSSPHIRFPYFYFSIGFMSIGISVISLSIKNDIVRVAKDYFRNFGLKFIVIGFIIILISIASMYSQINDYIMFLLYMTVVIYGYFSQLNKRHYYFVLGMMSHLRL